MVNCVDFGRHSKLFAAQTRAEHPPSRAIPISGRGTASSQLRKDIKSSRHHLHDPPSFARCCALPAQEDTDLHEARSSVDASLDASESASWHEETELQLRDDDAVAGSCDEPYSGRDFDNFPPEWRDALEGGRVPTQVAEAYLQIRSGVWGPLCKLPGFRDRLVADSSFMVKVGIEVGIGICTKTTAEATKRGPNFMSQLDFVLANILMALLADLALVYLPAPTIAYGSDSAEAAQAAEANPLQQFLQSCPENSFQKVPPGYEPFTLAQRGGALIRNGVKLLVVGTVASLVGVSVTDGIVAARHLMDPSWVHVNAPQDIISTSLAYGVYMAVSSNIRYQIIAGVVEERGIEVVFKDNKQLCNVLSLIVRTGNTYVGSLLWVDFLRWLGLQ